MERARAVVTVRRMAQAATPLVLSAEKQRVLRALVERMGERSLLVALTISRQSLSRALAGLPVRRGTLALIDGALAEPALRGVLDVVGGESLGARGGRRSP